MDSFHVILYITTSGSWPVLAECHKKTILHSQAISVFPKFHKVVSFSLDNVFVFQSGVYNCTWMCSSHTWYVQSHLCTSDLRPQVKMPPCKHPERMLWTLEWPVHFSSPTQWACNLVHCRQMPACLLWARSPNEHRLLLYHHGEFGVAWVKGTQRY